MIGKMSNFFSDGKTKRKSPFSHIPGLHKLLGN
jgi:hypothetical protein